MIRIDYDNSLVALASSVLKHFGAQSVHPTLKQLDELLHAKCYKNVVVMLFDGMGTAILQKHRQSAPFLLEHMHSTISSVFPPTTTAATRSIESGLTPLEHGWLGWDVYFKELDKTVNLFPNTEFGTNLPILEYNAGLTLLPYKSLEDKINEAGKAKAYFVSRHASIRVDSLEDISYNVKRLCAEQGRKYIYTYWNQPDFDMHAFGTTDNKIAEQIRLIDSSVRALCDELEDTLVIVTADHGLVDIKWETLLDYPDINDCLVRIPSIESRALTFFVKDGCHKLFEERFNKHFGSQYLLLTRDEVKEQGIFGSGTPHRKFDDFVGDYLAIATSDICLEVRAKSDFMFNAMHAGYTRDELDVPLIAIQA